MPLGSECRWHEGGCIGKVGNQSINQHCLAFHANGQNGNRGQLLVVDTLSIVKPMRRRNSIVTILVMCLIAAVGLVLLLIGGGGQDLWQIIFTQLGVAMMITMGIGALWDFAGRRWLADELFEKMNLGLEIQQWGLKELSLNWNDQRWGQFFTNARNVDLVVSYARTWRNVSESGLELFLASEQNRLRVCLPDPEQEWLMVAMAKRFNRDPETLKGDVLEAAKYFAEMRDKGEAKVQLFFRAGEPLYGLYKTDSSAIVTLYPHKKGRSTKIPTIAVERGEFLEFLVSDFNEAIDMAREVSDDELK